MESPCISFEFSAPKTDQDRERIFRVRERLDACQPSFYSITYGAGGSTKEGTRQTVLDLCRQGVNVAPHLSFGHDSAETIANLLADYKAAGVTRIVALRGDLPSGIASHRSLVYANELVAFIREKTGDHFHIEVAAYPEVHPDSVSVQEDIRYFKLKVDAGADSAITQYFYNPDAYFRFLELTVKAGVNIPIVPGIMPITNFRTLVRFSAICGAEIPRWIFKNLESLEDDSDGLKAFAEEVVHRLCERLLAGGAPGLHIYTLNQSLPAIRLLKNLGLTA